MIFAWKSDLQFQLSSEDDAQLAERVKRHEPQAMADMYDRYGRITYSLILRIVRSVEGRMTKSTSEFDELENPGAFADFEQNLLNIDRVRLVRDALNKLNPNQREVIEMAYYEGLSQSEMAERMKQPLGTVKTWARSALKLLRDQLGQAAI